MMLNIPGVVFLLSITVLSGMVMYAYFTKLGCDPLRAGEATNPNQVQIGCHLYFPYEISRQAY